MPISALFMALQYSGANMFAARDGMLALGNAVDGAKLNPATLKAIAKNGNKYDCMIAEANLNNQIANQMNTTEKALKKRWAQSFDTFA